MSCIHRLELGKFYSINGVLFNSLILQLYTICFKNELSYFAMGQFPMEMKHKLDS